MAVNPELTEEFAAGDNIIRIGIDEDAYEVQAYHGDQRIGVFEIHWIEEERGGYHILYSADLKEGYRGQSIGRRMLAMASRYYDDLRAPDPQHNSIFTAGAGLLNHGVRHGLIRPHELEEIMDAE